MPSGLPEDGHAQYLCHQHVFHALHEGCLLLAGEAPAVANVPDGGYLVPHAHTGAVGGAQNAPTAGYEPFCCGFLLEEAANTVVQQG